MVERKQAERTLATAQRGRWAPEWAQAPAAASDPPCAGPPSLRFPSADRTFQGSSSALELALLAPLLVGTSALCAWLCRASAVSSVQGGRTAIAAPGALTSR